MWLVTIRIKQIGYVKGRLNGYESENSEQKYILIYHFDVMENVMMNVMNEMIVSRNEMYRLMYLFDSAQMVMSYLSQYSHPFYIISFFIALGGNCCGRPQSLTFFISYMF